MKINVQFPQFCARLDLVAANPRDAHLVAAVAGFGDCRRSVAHTPATLAEVAREAGLRVSRRGTGLATQVVIGWL